jgi:hypothetical protein
MSINDFSVAWVVIRTGESESIMWRRGGKFRRIFKLATSAGLSLILLYHLTSVSL